MDSSLSEQLAYYCARANEYDEWFFRQGRYDRGDEATKQWFAEVHEVEAALAARAPFGDCLELACGTGLWTRHLAPHSTSLLAVDGSREMLDICRARNPEQAIQFVQADLFTWTPDRLFDTIFFAFCLSHVPPDRFEAFWRTVRAVLRPGAQVLFVDSRHTETSTATDHRLPPPEQPTLERKLNDGRKFRIYKIFHHATELEDRLAALGFAASVEATNQYFLHGRVQAGGNAQDNSLNIS